MMQTRIIQKESSLSIAPLTSIPPRVIETERLILRAISAGDGQCLFDLYAHDALASKYMSFKVTGRVDESEVFAQSVGDLFNGKGDVPIRQFSWLIQEKSSGAFIGSAGFGPLNDTTLSGGYILNRSFWGRGYASEVWTKLVEVAQADPGVQRIEAYHHPENPASGKVMLRAGMTYEGIRPLGSVYPNISDEKVPDIIYAWNRL
jgi:ribosomal-protein-alanine N-acetyltransferase